MGASRAIAIAGVLTVVAGTALVWFHCSGESAAPSRGAEDATDSTGELDPSPGEADPRSVEGPAGGAAAEPPERRPRRDRRAPATPPGSPGAAAGMAQRAGEQLATGDYNEAAESARRCLETDPDNASCRQVRRRALVEVGDWSTAMPLLEDCLAQAPDEPDCLGGMILARLARNELGMASALAGQLARVDPDSALSHFARANLLDAQGKLEEAQPHFAAACKLGKTAACRRASTRPNLPAR